MTEIGPRKNYDSSMLVDFKRTIEDFSEIVNEVLDHEITIEEFCYLLKDGMLLIKLLQNRFGHSFWSIFPLSDTKFHGAFIYHRFCVNMGITPDIDIDPFDIINSKRNEMVMKSLAFILSVTNSTQIPLHSGPMSEDLSEICSCLLCRWKKVIGVLSPASHPWSTNRLPNAVRRLVAEGVPASCREHVWLILSGALHLMRTRRPDYASHFPKALQKCPHLELIDLDISRTYQSYPEWRLNNYDVSTRRILAAYALRNPSVGYCQGLSYIVGLLVTIVNEEIAFLILSAIIEDGLLPPDYYTSLQGAMIDRKVVEHLIRQFLPELASRLKNQIEDYSFVTIPWNMCLFSTALRMEVSVRLWDFMFACGPSVLFKASLWILKDLESALVSRKITVNEIRSKLMHIETTMNANDVSLSQSMFSECTNQLVGILREEFRNPQIECQPLFVRDAQAEDSLHSCVSDDSYFGTTEVSKKRSLKDQEKERRNFAIDNLSLFMGQPRRNR